MTVPWAKFNKILKDFSEENFNEVLVWKKKIGGISRYGEGDSFQTKSYSVPCLVDYNYYARWPADKTYSTGTVDREDCAVYMHKDKLTELGLLNQAGNANIEIGNDQFEINGVKYLAGGDTDVAQTSGSPQLFLLILKRAPGLSGKESRP